MTRKFPLIPVLSLSLLLIPLIAMQFTGEVNWTVFDFLVMGVLLLSAGFGIQYILKKQKGREKKGIYILLLILAFLLIWAELAVGIFGTPFAGS